MDFYDYQRSSYSDQNGYYSSQIPDQDYSCYSYYPPPPPPPQQSYACYAYEYLPTRSMVAYSPCNEVTYTIPASTDLHHYAVYHSVATPSSPDLDFVQYDPHPFKGGYDIDQTYGKPLPPSDDICYPRSSPSPNLPFPPPPILAPAPTLALPPAPAPAPIPIPAHEEAEEDDLKSESNVTEDGEDQLSDDDDGDGGGSEDGSNEGAIQVYQGVGEYNGGVVIQNPPGYGLEAFDICENLFGYWPCLSKVNVNKRCDECGHERVVTADDADQWKRTADYLFGSPDPYGGSAEDGGYASANQATYTYHHQVQYQHPAYTLYQQQPDQSGQNSWYL